MDPRQGNGKRLKFHVKITDLVKSANMSDYFSIIPNTMDIPTIQNKMNSLDVSVYDSIRFGHDIHLMCQNTIDYWTNCSIGNKFVRDVQMYVNIAFRIKNMTDFWLENEKRMIK